MPSHFALLCTVVVMACDAEVGPLDALSTDGGRDAGAGLTPGDSGSAFVDAGSPVDSGVTSPADSGVTSPADSGVTSPADSGVTSPADSGVTSPADSGVTSPADSGVAGPADSGVASPVDSGVLPTDAGASGDGTSVWKLVGTPISYSFVSPGAPAKGATRIEPTTGATVRRLTNVSTDAPGNGNLYNAYSRYSAENVTGEYVLAITGTRVFVVNRTSGAFIGPLTYDSEPSHTLGDYHEVRWHMTAAHPYRGSSGRSPTTASRRTRSVTTTRCVGT